MSKRNRYKFEIENGTSNVTVVITKKRKIAKECNLENSQENNSSTSMKRNLESAQTDHPPAKRRRLDLEQKQDMDVDESYNCSYCNQSFDSESGAKIHEGLKHRGTPSYCLICKGAFKNEHAVKIHVGMKHKEKSGKSKKRQKQLKVAASKYNKSEKGKARASKYEKTTKAKKRRKKYKKSTKGQITIELKNREVSERKRQEKIKDKRWNFKDHQKTENAKFAWKCIDRQLVMEQGYKSQFLEKTMQDYKDIFGTDDYFDAENADLKNFKMQ